MLTYICFILTGGDRFSTKFSQILRIPLAPTCSTRQWRKYSKNITPLPLALLMVAAMLLPRKPEILVFPLDAVKKGGGWKDRSRSLKTHYLSKVPSEFARGMAGFWRKPFGLDRNRVDPPIALQQKIFPWIKDFYGNDNTEWKKACLDEMNQVHKQKWVSRRGFSDRICWSKYIQRETTASNLFISPGFITFQEQINSEQPMSWVGGVWWKWGNIPVPSTTCWLWSWFW